MNEPIIVIYANTNDGKIAVGCTTEKDAKLVIAAMEDTHEKASILLYGDGTKNNIGIRSKIDEWKIDHKEPKYNGNHVGHAKWKQNLHYYVQTLLKDVPTEVMNLIAVEYGEKPKMKIYYDGILPYTTEEIRPIQWVLPYITEIIN